MVDGGEEGVLFCWLFAGGVNLHQPISHSRASQPLSLIPSSTCKRRTQRNRETLKKGRKESEKKRVKSDGSFFAILKVRIEVCTVMWVKEWRRRLTEVFTEAVVVVDIQEPSPNPDSGKTSVGF